MAMDEKQDNKAVNRQVDTKSVREFGGPFGVILIILGSHLFMYYLWISWRFYGGALLYPHGFANILPFF